MKLSEAIRIGAKNRPQIKGNYFDYVDKSEHCKMLGACCIGSAIEGKTGSPVLKDYLENVLPELQNSVNYPPLVEFNQPMSIKTLIVQLNDHYGKSREFIAEELEKLGY